MNGVYVIKTGSSVFRPKSSETDLTALLAVLFLSPSTLGPATSHPASLVASPSPSGEGTKCSITVQQADMTVDIHDGGYGGSGRGGEGGIEVLNSAAAARRAGDHCEGDDDGDGDGNGDGDGGEPYVVFGYGSLIFRVRPCTSLLNIADSSPLLTRAFAASAARHQNKYASPH